MATGAPAFVEILLTPGGNRKPSSWGDSSARDFLRAAGASPGGSVSCLADEGAMLYRGLGPAKEQLGDTPGAVSAYRQSIAAQKARPSFQADAHLNFCWLVAPGRLSDLYTMR